MANSVPQRQTVAVVGVGNLGKYICEEIQQCDAIRLIVLSRKKNSWLEQRHIVVHRVQDYSIEQVLPILEAKKATTLISFLNPPPNEYLKIHTALLEACQQSTSCKRFIPSEWAGNITNFPHLPRFYATSRTPLREALADQQDVEWTVVNQGWLMDYFLKSSQTYMPAIPDEFPIDPNRSKACIRGTGDELQSWTCARDVATATVALLQSVVPWDRETYLCGDWGTFNEAVETFEEVTGTKLEMSHKDPTRIQEALLESDASSYEMACVEEWLMAGGPAVPKAIVLRQRDTFFKDVTFRDLKGLLVEARTRPFI